MKGILIYQPPDKTAQLPHFIDGLDPRLREKILLRVYQLSLPQKPELKEPHFKRFSLERYGALRHSQKHAGLHRHCRTPSRKQGFGLLDYLVSPL